MKYGKLAFFTLSFLFFYHHLNAWDINHGIVHEWSVGVELRPYDIVTLSDGSPWITHQKPDEAGKIFTLNLSDGTPVVYTAPFTANFHTLDRAADDTLWIADYADQIVHFDPLSGIFTPYPLDATIFPLPASPYGVTVAPDGKVWFTCWSDPSIGVLDPGTGPPGTWQRFALPSGGDYPPGVAVEIAFGQERPVWFTIREWAGRKAGFGNLDPDTGHFELWTDPSLFFPDLCCPVPPGYILRTPWALALTSLDPDFLWFTDKTANYLIKAEIVPSPLITREATPLPDIQDTHFFGIDPDGIFWLAAYGSDRIATYDELDDTFGSFPLVTGSNPMGISISPIGEVWWAGAGNNILGTGMGVGRFIPFTDSDGDGIDDGIDTDPGFSNDFDDGITSGFIVDRGDQDLVITEATNPHGVRIIASCSGGADAAMVTGCMPHIRRIRLEACREAILTCDSATIQALVGPLVVTLDGGIVVTVPSEAKVTITNITDGHFKVENSGQKGTVTLVYKDQVTELNPGESIGGGVDRFCPCAGPWKNHGKYVSCAAKTAKVYLKAGVITKKIKAAIVREAAQSSCGKQMIQGRGKK